MSKPGGTCGCTGWIRPVGRTVCAVALALMARQALGGEIRWRSGAVAAPQQPPAARAAALQAAAGEHIVVQFTRVVSPQGRQRLQDGGLTLLRYLGDGGYFAFVDPLRLDVQRVAAVDDLASVQPIERSWKVHPDLLAGEVPGWALVGAAGPASPDGPEPQPNAPADPRVAVYVLLHPDVPLAAAPGVARRHGGSVRSTLETVNGLVLELPLSRIGDLADEDEVQWIEPPLPRFDELNNSNRELVGADVVQAPPYDLDGSGIKVLVYDGGYALDAHEDFGGRLVVRDESGLSGHATHVAGTIGGSGAVSGGDYRGMAPGVTMESYGFQWDSEGVFLYNNPGDLEEDYDEAVNVHGVDLANNSIGTNTALYWDCAITGRYGVTSVLIDSIVRGSLGRPLRVVWANGNERQVERCGDLYHTTAPPACAKNHLTVGAVNSDDDTITDFTSWGPAGDGRLKPDVVAPGCQTDDDEGVTSCSSGGFYTVKCGTSMACPTVTGLSALLMQDYRAWYPQEDDFRNSTLRAVLAHTAEDLVGGPYDAPPGPDFQSGYGSVRVEPALKLLRDRNVFERSINQGDTLAALVVVNPGDNELRVTLAWDDVPGTPNVDGPALINDLDLRVFDPEGNRHFPWTLDPEDPERPAVRTQEDHLNNLEQVFIEAPEPGAYRIEVHGFSVPQGPQPFSLAATPFLVSCSPQGTVTLDRSKYACEADAVIQVVDCDLDTDSGLVETVEITMLSESEPDGENLVLTETGPDTATFRGTLELNTADSPGVLLVAHGDTVSATYIDADDGLGGEDVVVTDTAAVDCLPPVISAVGAVDLEPRSAVVSFLTDEQSRGIVRYGLACDALTEQADETGFHSEHTFPLEELLDDTVYFFAVQATDEAGNTAADDHGGACYSFATPKIPDFFTERFHTDAPNDLAYTRLLFVPDGSDDSYSLCGESIAELPTDPTSGAALDLDVDDFAPVALADQARVQLYGTSYDTLFLGSNGYLTFGSGDKGHSESLETHFDQPRVSGLFDDLDPSFGGAVVFEQFADRAVATWWGVPEYKKTNANTFQIELFFDGRIALSYLAIDAEDGLAGLSEGEGLSPDFVGSDLSVAGPCGPRPPLAVDGHVQTPLNQPVTIGLVATDDGLPDPPAALTYVITALPASGTLHDPAAGDITAVPHTLAGTEGQVVYTPSPGYAGDDAFAFQASDGGTPPEGGDSNMADVTVVIGGPEPVYSFPLDEHPGWAMEAQWAFGPPLGMGGELHGHPDPAAGASGSSVLGVNLEGDYSTTVGAPRCLTAGPFDCSELTDTRLRFHRWLNTDYQPFVRATVDASPDGNDWTVIWENGDSSTSPQDAWWQPVSYDIASLADGQAEVYVRWTHQVVQSGAWAFSGWNIDDVEIWGVRPGVMLAVPQSLEVLRGEVLSGDVEALHASDDSRLCVRLGFVMSDSESPVWLVLSGTAPQPEVAELRFLLEARADAAGLTQRLELLNQLTGEYEGLDARVASLTDSIVEVVVTDNASRFVHPDTLELKAQLTWRAEGPVSGHPWQVAVDQAVWKISP